MPRNVGPDITDILICRSDQCFPCNLLCISTLHKWNALLENFRRHSKEVLHDSMTPSSVQHDLYR